MVIWSTLVWAGPVVCDAERAKALIEETRVKIDRVPVVAPSLLPGLARGRASGAAREHLDALCATPAAVSLVPHWSWEGGTYDAYTFRLAASETEGCALVQRSVHLSVGVRPGHPLAVDVLDVVPPTITPIGDCPVRQQYREETVLAGDNTRVRLVLQVDHSGSDASGRVLVRQASTDGWTETVLIDPAPPHLMGGRGGPQLTLTGASDPWIVAHHAVSPDCTPQRGQTVWFYDQGTWQRVDGRAALGKLANRGLWRLAGDDGWFLVVAQDDPSDRGLLEARTRKRQSLSEHPLRIRESGRFPLMNAGFLFVAPDPWVTRAEAEQAREDWPRSTGVYLRQGWEASFDCSSD